MPVRLVVVGLVRIVRYQPDHGSQSSASSASCSVMPSVKAYLVMWTFVSTSSYQLLVVDPYIDPVCTQDSGREGLYSHQPRSPS